MEENKDINKESSGKEELTRQIKEHLLKEVERMDSHPEKSPEMKSGNRGEIKNSNIKIGDVELFKRGIAADNYRIKSQAGRNEEAQRIKSEAQREAERQMNHEFQKSARMSGVKGRIASKIASRGMSEAAYAIAVRLSEKANQGGYWAVIVFIVTLLMAIIADVLDIIGTFLIETFIGWLIIFLINATLLLIINIFWMLLAGGGHSKLFWKILIKYVVFGLILDSIPIIELFPFTVFIVCWNWYDFSKERNDAKQELKRFSKVYAKTGKIRGQSMKYA